MDEIGYQVNPVVTHDEINTLFAAARAGHEDTDFTPVLSRSLVYIGAYDAVKLVGFVNVAWDGDAHAFCWHYSSDVLALPPCET